MTDLNDERPLQFPRPPGPMQITGRAKTVIGVCLDESSSMYDARQRTIEAFNAFLIEQQANTADDCFLTLHKFNGNVWRHNPLQPIQHVVHLTPTTYTPGGITALCDAIAHVVSDLQNEGADADRFVVVVITDGMENASKETTKLQVFDLIAEKERTGRWTFVYLSATPSAFTDGASLGFHAGNTASINTGQMVAATHSLSASMSQLRTSNLTSTRTFSGTSAGADWSSLQHSISVSGSAGTPTVWTSGGVGDGSGNVAGSVSNTGGSGDDDDQS